jgi:hypothetical protein
VDFFDKHLNFAMALHAEAQKDRVGFFTDFMYLSVAADRDTLLGTTANTEIDGFIGEAGMFYTVYSKASPHRAHENFRIDGFVGLRVTSLGLDVDTENLGSADDSRTWYDPFIGVRGGVGVLRWLSIKGRGDIGGFEVFGDDGSQFTWSANAAASFHLARWCDLDAGYRWLSYDYEDGDRFAFDAVLHGPYVELVFKF